MQWFGTPWPAPGLPAPVCEDLHRRTAVPVGERCGQCGEPVEEGDSGVTMLHIEVNQFAETIATLKPQHVECFIRSSVGSLAHLAHRCSCAGVTDDFGEPNLTFRQEARLVFFRMMAEALEQARHEDRPAVPIETPQSDFDHHFVSKPYTKTCWWRLLDAGGRCEHLAESTIHRGTEAWKRLHHD